MPQAVAFAAAKAVAIFTAKGIVAQVARTIGINLLLTAASRALTPKASGNGVSLAARTVTTQGGVQTRTKVYGELTKPGHLFYRQVGGSDNQYLYECHAFASHEIDSFVSLKLDRYTDIDLATDVDGSGFVTLPEYADADGNKLLRVSLHLGATDQAADADLVAEVDEWTANHRARGVAYIVLRYEADRSSLNADPSASPSDVWSNGLPPTVQARIKGAKVYDPRDAGQSATNPATWVYSDNPALCLFDYLKAHPTATVPGHFGEDRSRIPESFVIAAADECDELVSIPGSATEKRYRLALDAGLDAEPSAIVDAMAQAMVGAVVYSGGEYEIHAGSYAAPTITIDGDWLAGGFSRQLGYSRADRYNEQRSLFTPRDDGRTAIEAPSLQVAAFVSADGGVIAREETYAGVRDQYQVQRIGLIRLRASRNGDQIEMTCNLRALSLKTWGYVMVDLPDFGISATVYKVTQWGPKIEGGALLVSMVLAEAQSDLYDVSVSDLQNAIQDDAPTTVAEFVPPVVTATATGGQGQAVLSWQNPEYPERQYTEVWSNDTNSRGGSTRQGRFYGESFSEVLPDGESRYYWLLVRSRTGAVSAWYPESATDGLAATTSTPPASGGSVFASVSPSSVGATGANGSLNTNPATVTASGGTAPYSYLWERVSGDATVTPINVTSATTQFTASGTDEVKRATWRCRVSDNGGSVAYTPNVPVTLNFGTF